jgi:simple sugar transport system substrate-binding protein/ribose transport system substrate-binding protein
MRADALGQKPGASRPGVHLEEESMFSNKFTRTRVIAGVACVAMLALTACGGGDDTGTSADSTSGSSAGKPITVGFSQVGSESGWRAANTKSIQETLTAANGFDLKFSDAQQKQENQIQAIRSYIAQKVDVIAFSPVVESGWDAVLEEAKAANIPVVLTDRSVDSTDDSLYVSFLGSDFLAEGKKAGLWAVQQFKDKPTNIVELTGTTGSAPTPTSRSSPRRRVTSPAPRARRRWRACCRLSPTSTWCSRTTTTWASAPSKRSKRPARCPARTSRS